MTFSADGTAHRNINYNSRHVNLKAESYGSNNGTKERVTRFFGIQPSVDNSSKQAVIDWDKILKAIVDLFNRSPFGKRTGGLLQVVEILIKLAGMHGDHCAKEKKDAQMIEKMKIDAIHQILGENEILECSNEELLPHFLIANEQMIKEAGGQDKWNSLSEQEKAERQAVMLEKILIRLGKEAYDMLDDKEKRILRLFIWAGCGCHKDLNTIRGGYAAIIKWWGDNDVEPPVLLANRDNAAILKDISTEDDIENSAQARAFKMSSCGGVKATQLAGAILNHKDDKQGHHDIFRWWWMTNVGIQMTFPDTSNNRFQSHCEAAGVLLLHLDHFIAFLDYIRKKRMTCSSAIWKRIYGKHCTAQQQKQSLQF